MIRVLIVDDDSIARTNLKTLIDWGKHSYEISGEAVNGSNAIQEIEASRPDIVITDMSMPVMDGVALIEYLERNYHGIKVIALSGYDDFNYVRQSMKRGTIDYLLKHRLGPELLLGTLENARKAIMEDREVDRHMQKLQEQLTESRTIMRQDFVRQLVFGAVGGLELIGKARALPGMRFTPILALTTESQQAKRDEAKRNGATGWLVKPIAPADLLKVIRQVVPGA